MDENLPDTREMATQLRVCVPVLRQWVRKGIVPVIRINKRVWRFDVPSVREALKARSGLEQTR
jgi:predicted site-specific integrase-resolvase